MRKINNKGFFLAETIVVVTIVATVLVLFYSQISKLYHSYENNANYNTVNSLHAANNVKRFLIQEDLHAVITSLNAASPASIIDITNYDFTEDDYFASIKTATNIRKIYFAKYNINNIIDGTETFAADASVLKFIKNLKKVTAITSTTKFNLIISFTDGSFANLVVDTEDHIAPVITLIGNDEVSSNATLNSYTDQGATAVDNVDGVVSVTSVSTVVANVAGTYTVTYTATDDASNVATKTRTINVFTYKTNYSVAGNFYIYTVPHTGSYKIDLWGSAGGYGAARGGYTSGTTTFTKGEKLYFYVGNQVSIGNGTSFNGGTGTAGGTPGGGATDVRYIKKYRYIRDYLSGSSSNTNDHWIEIMAYTADGTNVALNKTVTSNGALENANALNDGITTAVDVYARIATPTDPKYVEIDLGAEYEIVSVQIYHYYNDARTYYGTKTELINEDRDDNLVVFNALINSGTQVTYVETSAGRTYNIGLRSRIMVAGGGGSGVYAGAGGGLTGSDGTGGAYGGTQTAGGAQQTSTSYGNGGFGYGGGGCGGGGGYYGGGGATCATGGAGGSSFISGYTGTNAVDAQEVATGQTYHYSGKVFTNTLMYSGLQAMPGPTGVSEQGHAGSGYARITYMP